MTNIPDIFTTLSGVKITEPAQWNNYRKEEILNLFKTYMYGERDIERPEDLKFTIVKESIEYGMRIKNIEASFNEYSFPFRFYLPEKQTKPIPVIIYVMHENLQNHLEYDEEGNLVVPSGQYTLPAKYITDRGFGVVALPTRGIYYDWNARANYKKGVFASFKPLKERTKNSWGTISAWAWAVSRVVDYLEMDTDVNRNEIMATGFSRSGKTALWAAATDQRIRQVNPNNSGCCGASMLRGKSGEHLKGINVSDWFCEKLKDFNDCEELLPVDQHMLLALIAPRPLYITESVDDNGADPKASLRAARLASELYEFVGKKGLIMEDEEPIVNKVYQEGLIGYHVKTGNHSQTMFDWENMLNFFEKNLR